MLTAGNSPIKHKDLILALSEAVQLLTQVEVIHCRGHQRDGSFVNQENRKADQTAKHLARVQEPEQIVALVLTAAPPPPAGSLAFPSIPNKNKKTLKK